MAVSTFSNPRRSSLSSLRIAASLVALGLSLPATGAVAQDGGSSVAPAVAGDAPSSSTITPPPPTGATPPAAGDTTAPVTTETVEAVSPPGTSAAPGEETPTDLAALQSKIPANPVYDSLAAEFDRNPKVFFDAFVARGSSIAVPARNVLLSRPSAIDQIIEAMRTYGLSTEPARQLAVGVGQAALVYSKTLPEVSLALQERMAGLESETIRLAFAAATGDIATAALGFGSAGGGGGTASASGPSISGNALSGSANSGNDQPIDVVSRQTSRSGGLTLGAVSGGAMGTI